LTPAAAYIIIKGSALLPHAAGALGSAVTNSPVVANATGSSNSTDNSTVIDSSTRSSMPSDSVAVLQPGSGDVLLTSSTGSSGSSLPVLVRE
jgi:hypothetical protein